MIDADRVKFTASDGVGFIDSDRESTYSDGMELLEAKKTTQISTQIGKS